MLDLPRTMRALSQTGIDYPYPFEYVLVLLFKSFYQTLTPTLAPCSQTPMMDRPSEDTGSTPATTPTITSPEVKTTPISCHNLSMLPRQSASSRWLTAEQIYAGLAATQHAQPQMPEPKAESKAICPLSGEPFEQPIKSQSRRLYVKAGCSGKRPSAAGTSPNPQSTRPSVAHVLDAPPECIYPANEDL